MSANKRPTAKTVSPVDDILALINELTIVLEDETILLSKHDVSAHQALLLQKNKLLMAYRTKMKTLLMKPEMLRQAPPMVKAKLKEAHGKLAQAAKLNVSKLEIAVHCAQRLVQHLMKHIKDKVMPKQGYSDPRQARFKHGPYSPVSPAIAVNRTA